MKRIWGLTLCTLLATLLYAGVIFILKINPLKEFTAFLGGRNVNFLALLSPFIFITTLYYILYFVNILFAQKTKKVNDDYQLVNNNYFQGGRNKKETQIRRQKTKSVLGQTNELEISNETDNSEYSTNNQEQPLTNNHKRDISNNTINEIDQKTQELEGQLNNSYNNKAKNVDITSQADLTIQQDTKKSKPVVLTILKDDISTEPHPLFLNDLSANTDDAENKEISLNKENKLEKIREELEHEEKYALETLSLNNNHIVSDIEALAVAEGLEEGNALLNHVPDKPSNKTSVSSVLDNLLEMEGLDDILSNNN